MANDNQRYTLKCAEPSRNRFSRTEMFEFPLFANIKPKSEHIKWKSKRTLFTWMNDIAIATKLIQSHFNEIYIFSSKRCVRFIRRMIYIYTHFDSCHKNRHYVNGYIQIWNKVENEMKTCLFFFRFFKYLCLLFLLIHFSIDRYYILCFVTYWCNSLDIRI